MPKFIENLFKLFDNLQGTFRPVFNFFIAKKEGLRLSYSTFLPTERLSHWTWRAHPLSPPYMNVVQSVSEIIHHYCFLVWGKRVCGGCGVGVEYS